MKPLLAAAALSAALAGPASATEWVICGDGEEKASFEVLLGSLDVIAIDTIRISADGKQWSTKPDAGETKIEVGQAFDVVETMAIGVTPGPLEVASQDGRQVVGRGERGGRREGAAIVTMVSARTLKGKSLGARVVILAMQAGAACAQLSTGNETSKSARTRRSTRRPRN